jgi:hypothetical protein
MVVAALVAWKERGFTGLEALNNVEDEIGFDELDDMSEEDALLRGKSILKESDTWII